MAREKIAIVGMGCVFPGAMDFTEYWQNIVEGTDSIKEVDPCFWQYENFYDPDPNAPDMTYCKMGGQSGPIEFDTKEWGISPKVMEHTAVEQLFGLVVARQALMDAGYYGKNARPFNRENTGVIMSAGTGSHVFNLHCRTQRFNIKKILVNNGVPEAAADMMVAKYLDTLQEWSEDDNPGYIPNVVAGRIANRFDLGGTSCSVDAACGASLGAVKFAVDELQSGNMDMMLVGGANLDNSPVSYLSFTKTPASSRTGKIKPFDANADGMIIGDGVGIMVLKRLSDAERDGDKIYALICGSGSSSDGRAKSIYAPSHLQF
jgi:acyl transferase domain-containing protein